MSEVFTSYLNKTLPNLEMCPDIADYFGGILARSRNLHQTVLSLVDFSNGQLFITLPADPRPQIENIERCGNARRGKSLEMLENICYQYMQDSTKSVIFDNAKNRPNDQQILDYDFQDQILTIENDFLFQIHDNGIRKEAVEAFVWWAAGTFFPVGVFTTCPVSKNADASVTQVDLVDAVNNAEAFVFSICDFMAFAIWCPNQN